MLARAYRPRSIATPNDCSTFYSPSPCLAKGSRKPDFSCQISLDAPPSSSHPMLVTRQVVHTSQQRRPKVTAFAATSAVAGGIAAHAAAGSSLSTAASVVVQSSASEILAVLIGYAVLAGSCFRSLPQVRSHGYADSDPQSAWLAWEIKAALIRHACLCPAIPPARCSHPFSWGLLKGTLSFMSHAAIL